MSLLKKDNRWVSTAFYFTFFPPLPLPMLLLFVLYSLAFIAFVCVWHGEGDEGTGNV